MVSALNPVTLSKKELNSSVFYNAQHMVLDLVFLARGSIQGIVKLGDNPAPNAFVRVMPELDVIGTQLIQADEQGRYRARNLPIGNLSVLAVGSGNQSNATGIAVGALDSPDGIPTVNVTLTAISGVVSGRVSFQDGDSTPAMGSLVIAYSAFEEAGGPGRPVGFAFTDRDGRFKIYGLPLRSIVLESKDTAGNIATQRVELAQAGEVTGVQLSYPVRRYGSVSGRVLNENGAPISNAEVRTGYQAVKSDAAGAFVFSKVTSGDCSISAIDPNTRLAGNAIVTVRADETASGVSITIARPAVIRGRVLIQRGAGAALPVENAIVSNGSVLTRTDAQGAYTLKNVSGNASYILRFVHPNGKLAVNQPVVIAQGESLERNATFRPSTLRGRVFQPDGVVGTVAQLSVSTLRPSLGPERFGLLAQREALTQSLADGSYSVDDVNPGPYGVAASNVFFPVPVRSSGTLGGNQTEQSDLILVDTLAGKIQGRVFQPQGAAAGAGVQVTLSSYSFPEVTVPTDESGRYEFAEVLPEGSYFLTATDPVTKRTNRINVTVQSNRDATFDITLLGGGNLRLRVVDAAGNQVTSGDARVEGINYPNANRFSQVVASDGAALEFNDLPEGPYGVSVSRLGLSGREAIKVIKGATVDVTVKLQASGTVKGRVLRPDRATGAGLADISLVVDGRALGTVPGSDVEGEEGVFNFLNVPAGTFTLEAFDNRTGRRGSATGMIEQQGETAVINIQLTPVGNVVGQVTANGTPVPNALVSIYDSYRVFLATADQEGRYRFTGIPVGSFVVSVVNAPGGLSGQASGQVAGTGEPLDDTVADVTVQPSATFVGTIRSSNGRGPLPGARVTIVTGFGSPESSQFFSFTSMTTTADETGRYRFDYIAISESTRVKIRAQATTGFDRGEVLLASTPAPGQTITTDVTLAGVGSVGGQVTDHLGNPVFAGTVTLVNDEFGAEQRVSISAPVQSNGQYLIANAPAGPFTLNLAVPDNM
ncbi:MAG TPA: carboxypeptidase-like regulatory domain-containing protein, partial [Blastocatellia bacterium]